MGNDVAHRLYVAHRAIMQVKSSGRVNRANQRKLASLYSAGDMSSDLAKYNQFKVSE